MMTYVLVRDVNPAGTGGHAPKNVERGTVIRHVPPNMAQILLYFQLASNYINIFITRATLC